MGFSWLKREKRKDYTPDGQILYAIGDIHGRDDLLVELLDLLAGDLKNNDPEKEVSMIFLGDYVDRGLGSKAVLDRLIALEKQTASPEIGLNAFFLMGNHEEALLRFMDDPGFGEQWLVHGGTETLLSYGVQPPKGKTDPSAWQTVSAALREALGEAHRGFLERLRDRLILGDYIFVHAGLRPGVALEAQTTSDLLWIRNDFIHDTTYFEKKVVHGHTPKPQPYADHRRIGIDTGAYITGTLTAVRLEADAVSYLQTGMQ
jgi:Calcineurin-like phosphoesterase